jgi:hypothetical protein
VRSENLALGFGESMQRQFVTAGLMESGGGYCSPVAIFLPLDPLFLVVMRWRLQTASIWYSAGGYCSPAAECLSLYLFFLVVSLVLHLRKNFSNISLEFFNFFSLVLHHI